MSNLAEQLFYDEGASLVLPVPVRRSRRSAAAKNKTVKAARISKARGLSPEDAEIVAAINTVRRELECLHNRYDNTADELLVESLIYEIKAANMKYQYFLSLCKDKGIVCLAGGLL